MLTSPLPVDIITREPVRVAYLRHLGPYGPSIERFWVDTVAPWMVAHGLENAPRYGVSLDDPHVTPPDQCRYDACIAVSDSFDATDGAKIATIPGGRYAALDFSGPVWEVGEAWNTLLREWVPNSGFQIDTRPMFEYYPIDAMHDAKTGAFHCVICIPVTKR